MPDTTPTTAVNPFLSSQSAHRDATMAPASASDPTGRLANKDVFMKLLVAQIQYQNPLNPSDGIEFMTQLTQFTQLEQSIAMRQSLETIATALTARPDSGGADSQQP